MRATWLALILVATFPVAGALDALYWDGRDAFPPTTVVHSLAITILCFAWCKLHAREIGRNASSGAALFCAVIPPLGIPVYLIRAKGWKLGAISIGKVALASAAASALYYLAYMAVAYQRGLI